MARKADSPKLEAVRAMISEFGDIPSLRLAKLARKRHPKLFRSVENARTTIRYLKGQSGTRLRDNARAAGNSELFTEAGSQDRCREFIEAIPEPCGTIEPWKAHPVPGRNVLVISDAHVPYHDRDALSIAIEYGVRRGCDAVLINGDLIDFHRLSRWEQNPEARSFAGELEDTRKVLKLLRDTFGTVVYSQGNHEQRYTSFMRRQAPDFLEISDFKFEGVMHLEELGIQHIPSYQYARIGMLPIVHGHEFGKSVFSPVNPARGYWLRAKTSVLGGHYHRSSAHSEKTLDGTLYGCWSTGCLCHLSPEYLRVNGWNLGFARVEVIDDSGRYTVDNRKIIGTETYSA